MTPIRSTRKVGTQFNRRKMLGTSIGLGSLSLPAFLQQQAAGREAGKTGQAKSCIIVFCWGGISHIDSFDTKPGAPSDIRGEFSPIQTATPGIHLSEHLPLLAQQTGKLAIIRSIHHDDSAHGRGMYWNLTGHKPPRSGNIPPKREDWPSLAAMISKFRAAAGGLPRAIRLPYPMVDNGTLQAGEYGGWLGAKYDPIVMRTPAGKEFEGSSRTLGSPVFEFGQVDQSRVSERHRLLESLEQPLGVPSDFETHLHFRQLAVDTLIGSALRNAYDLEREDPKIRDMYGNHLGGQSLLLARRLTEAGVPVVQVCCAAGDLNGGAGDMWDTHGDNFNRLKKRLLPVFDQGVSALLQDLSDRGTLDETLVAVLTDFGRTPKINGAAGRDHYPNVYSVALAGGGISGGQVYGSSDRIGAYPRDNPCGPADIHATIFQALGISPSTEIRDPLGRPFPLCDGRPLPLS